MIDLHSHILFNLDDGIKTKEKMFESIKFLSSLGYMEIIPTPHKYHILFNPKLEDVKERISYIKSSMIKRFYEEFAVHPLSETSEALLHTGYEPRIKTFPLEV
jgi:tyrosine-protein phosphatase YwqE